MHYATYDRYGSQTSYGFDNSKVVVAFRTKALRDKYVKDHGYNNLGIDAVTRKEALKISKNVILMDDAVDETPNPNDNCYPNSRYLEFRNGRFGRHS